MTTPPRHFASHVFAALSLCAQWAAAQAPLSLRWSGPAECPPAEEVRQMALNGVDREAPALGLEAEAVVRSVEVDGVRRYRVELRTRRGEEHGERSIEAATCRGVAEATALVLSLALTSQHAPSGDGAAALPSGAAAPPSDGAGVPPSGGAAPLSPATATEPVAPAAAAGATAAASQPSSATNDAAARSTSSGGAALTTIDAAPPPPAPSKRAARSLVVASRSAGAAPRSRALALGLSLAGDSASLPSAAVGGALSLGWQTGGTRVEIEARRWMSQSRTIEAFAAGARFSMTSIGARGCWAAAAEALIELGPCGGVDVHMVAAPGHGVDPDYDASAEWMAFAAGAQGRLLLTSWLALRARLEASIPLSRPIFVLEGGGRLHQPAALGGAAWGRSCSFFDETRWSLPLIL